MVQRILADPSQTMIGAALDISNNRAYTIGIEEGLNDDEAAQFAAEFPGEHSDAYIRGQVPDWKMSHEICGASCH